MAAVYAAGRAGGGCRCDRWAGATDHGVPDATAKPLPHPSCLTGHPAVPIACCAVLGLVVAMLPWWIRNARLTGHLCADHASK